MRLTSRPLSTGEVASPFTMCTTDTTTAASPGHFSRRVARRIAPPSRNDLREARSARIALADRVSCNQPKHAALTEQTESASEEMRDQVGIPMRALMQCLAGSHGYSSSNCRPMIVFLPSKGRIADDGVKPTVLPRRTPLETRSANGTA